MIKRCIANGKMKNFAALNIFLAILYFCQPVLASKFEELDKPPEGAHKGQMFLGGFISMGAPVGSVYDAENNFVKDSLYEFSDSNTYKRLWISHLCFTFGASFEYMPMDYLGVKTKIKRFMVIQRTDFGSDYENWSRVIYGEYSFLVGPAIHATTRKQWDFTLTPVLGYGIATFTPTPIAKKLISSYSGTKTQTVSNLVLGAELNFTIYFSGGLYVSLGFDWNMNFLKFKDNLNLTYTDAITSDSFTYKGKSAPFHSVAFILSAGYAFSN